VVSLTQALAEADPSGSGPLRTALRTAYRDVRAEKLGEVAEEFENVHTIERARQVGSVDRVISAESLRPYVVDALERGMRRARDSTVRPVSRLDLVERA
jgi:hypothetical protein